MTFEAFHSQLASLWESFKTRQGPNEATTEQDLIRPLLDALGWTDYLPQQDGYCWNTQTSAWRLA